MSSAPGTRPDRRAPGGRRPRRVVEDRPGSSFFVSDLDGAPRWVGGMLAGLQGALLSLLVVVLPAVAVYVATSATPTAQGVAWTHAVRVAAGLWLLAHGAPLTVEPAVTLLPLGLTALALFSCFASARRSGYATRSALGAGVAAYLGVLVVVGLLAGAPVLHLVLAVMGGAVVSVVGIGTGLLRRPEAPRLRDLLAPVRERLPEAVHRGVLAGVAALASLVLLAAALVTLWIITGRTVITDVVAGLGLDAVGGVVLAIAELAYLPTLVVWALAWIAGPGFQVGAGTSFAVDGASAGALPAVPLLGALPAPDVSGGVLRAVPVLLVLVGAAVALVLRRRLVTTRALDPVIAALVLAGTAGLGAVLLGALSGGGIGPGRMAELGPDALPLGLAVALGTGIGALLVLLPGDRHVRAMVARGARRAWAGITRRPVPEVGSAGTGGSSADPGRAADPARQAPAGS